ncbi:ATP-binding cassette domain-containing protein [Streptomyces sp. NPDC059009]|uniref:ABC transporter ATP-binding protein n=1 Tax=Streptomyces sp. NPDC059009 TaxID=3346694 RepID=UPI00367CCFFD
MIRFEDVSVTYEDAPGPTVQGVELTIPEGELVLLVGPSGVGKSTLLGTVSGLVPHFTGGTLRGRVTVAGRDTRTHKPRELADVVGTVGQDPLSHFVTDTVEDELAYGMESLGLAPEVMRRRVEETLDLLGLAGLRDRPIATLSGGQQQRVAIGSVLTPHPQVLVLDEPTSALDPAAAEEVLAVLQRLVHDLGTTVLMAEHRLERVVQYADQVLLLPSPTTPPVLGAPAELMAISPVYPPVVGLGRLAGWSPLPLTVRDARRGAGPLRERLAKAAEPGDHGSLGGTQPDTTPTEQPATPTDPQPRNRPGAGTRRYVRPQYSNEPTTGKGVQREHRRRFEDGHTAASPPHPTATGRPEPPAAPWWSRLLGRRRAAAPAETSQPTGTGRPAGADQPPQADRPGTPPPTTLPAHVQSLALRRGRVEALRRVDLRAAPGETIAVMGRNGAGKSTLLSALVGLLAPTAGSVRVGGADPHRTSPRELLRHVGLVPQEPRDLLYADTVGAECAAADRDADAAPGTCRALVSELLPGIPDDTHPRDLSEGQRLTLALAIVLTARPPLLLLDEPTRGLDYAAKARLVTALRRLTAEGHAIILATHDVELAAELAHRVVILADGEVVADGPTPDIVVSSPSFAPQVTKILAPQQWLTVAQVRRALGVPS